MTYLKSADVDIFHLRFWVGKSIECLKNVIMDQFYFQNGNFTADSYSGTTLQTAFDIFGMKLSVGTDYTY